MRKLLKIVALFLAASSIAFAVPVPTGSTTQKYVPNKEEMDKYLWFIKGMYIGKLKIKSHSDKCWVLAKMGFSNEIKKKNYCYDEVIQSDQSSIISND
jgi:hypothetical protein